MAEKLSERLERVDTELEAMAMDIDRQYQAAMRDPVIVPAWRWLNIAEPVAVAWRAVGNLRSWLREHPEMDLEVWS